MMSRDEQQLASVGMTLEDVQKIAAACEAGDYSMWDSQRICRESPLTAQSPVDGSDGSEPS